MALSRAPLSAPQHLEEGHDLIVEVVVDLGIGARLADEHARRAAERLDIDPVWREVRQDPRREFPLAAVPAENRTGGPGHGVNAPDSPSRLIGGLSNPHRRESKSWAVACCLTRLACGSKS